MSIENLAFVKKNSKISDIFTKTIKITISESDGLIDFNINNIAHILVKNPRTHQTSLHLPSNGGNKKSKTSKKKQTGGGFKSMILFILINYFMFNFIVSIQIAQNPQNYLESEKAFHESNPLDNPEIRSLIDSVKHISIDNQTNVSTGKVLQLINTDGIIMEQSSTNIGDDFDTAFAEVKYDTDSATQKFIKLTTMLPHIKRPLVSVMSFGLNSRTRYYGLFAKWELVDNDIQFKLFNVTDENGKYPDDRARNFPNGAKLNKLAEQTLKEHIKTMKQTNLIRDGETSGFATIGAFNFPIYPGLFGNSHSFHQDGMSLITNRKNINKEEDLEMKIKRSIGKPILKNSTFSRTNIFDQVMAMSYPPETSVEAGNQLHIVNNIGDTVTTPINVRDGEATTRMLQQNRGAQHSSRSEAMFNLKNMPKSRTALLVNVMPDKNFILDEKLIYTVRK
jgi:hypothetical protein